MPPSGPKTLHQSHWGQHVNVTRPSQSKRMIFFVRPGLFSKRNTWWKARVRCTLNVKTLKKVQFYATTTAETLQIQSTSSATVCNPQDESGTKIVHVSHDSIVRYSVRNNNRTHNIDMDNIRYNIDTLFENQILATSFHSSRAAMYSISETLFNIQFYRGSLDLFP